MFIDIMAAEVALVQQIDPPSTSDKLLCVLDALSLWVLLV
jgi:hypothetical protein